MFGFMATTAFLSMWISNTATTAMMVPIAHAVLTQLSNHRITAPANSAAESREAAGDQLPTHTDVCADQQHSRPADPRETAALGAFPMFNFTTSNFT